ncbi:hypothetical protein M9H77_16113 [Catharanthus roseus]|uniref:Uncharacterized protein n=1 Tax=Catharanthus roseus TaxID=4058 RepID=A0ACC0B0L4_CATRO|nr:hypothetical protein M9H77_16113 [Catharanthus roseus]
MKCHSRARRTRSGSHNEVIGIKFQHLVAKHHTNWSKYATNSWSTYQVCFGTNLSLKPLLALHKAAVLLQSMMRCPRRPIGPRPPWYYAPLQVDLLSQV